MEFPTGNINIEITSLTDSCVKFILNNVDTSFANAFRRMMISEVPTMAIEFVNVNNNTSCLHDEFLCHRLGLIPLQSHNIEKYQYFMDCKFCQGGIGCDYCSVRLTLKVKNEYREVRDVTSMDIRSDNDDVKPAKWYSVINKDNDGNPAEIGILIGKIKEGQEIDVEMIARKGISKDHFKYCPSTVATFKYEAQIDINYQYMNMATREQKAAFVRSCPTKVYELTSTDEVIVADHLKCIFCDECVKATEPWKLALPPVKVGFKKFRFHFSVETNGSLRPEEIVYHAFNELRGKLTYVKETCEAMRNPSYMSNR